MGYSYVYPPLKNGLTSAQPHAPSPPKGSFHDVDDSDYIDGFGTLIDDGDEFIPSQPGGGDGNFIFPDEIAGGFNNEVDPPFPTASQDDFQV